ncbi:UPF0505 protein [Selaginella moellendorffii]|uniref:UPF0505 protein n=1 Tax=Selaginella moellendorffii TaxID=88036 RepID=UPI000D1CF710|nr:UPF0505 protein [Selaginella moellendorffii]|eukprot:XP_024530935.1 UPF0505 protein [Selaginella moellendorffii]
MAGQFRARRYELEGAAASLDRHPAAAHPLLDHECGAAAASIHCAVLRDEKEPLLAEVVFDDPLRSGGFAEKDLASPPAMWHKSKTSRRVVSKSVMDEQVENAAADWDAYKLTLSQRFGSSGTMTMSSAFDVLAKDHKAAGTSTHLQQLEDPERKAFEDVKILTQQECVTRLKDLNEEIAEAWRSEERVSALRLTIKVARLLMDTSVAHFYPVLFVLVTDVLDNVGDLVWMRIKKKAETDENGNAIELPVDFSSSDISQEAKDTCNNWFLKIGSIKELLPRIYLEIAILRCLQFLERDPISTIQRLSSMVRGLGSPLTSAYAYIYLSRKGLALLPMERGYLVSGIHDFTMLLYRLIAGEFNQNLLELHIQKQTYVRLVEPMFEWVLHCIFKLLKQEETQEVVVALCGKREKDGMKPLSILVHYLLKQLPATFVANHAIEISRLVKSSTDISMPQSASFVTLGRKMCDCPPPREFRLQVLSDVWKATTKYTSLIDYVAVANAFVEYILQCCSETELIVVLRDLKQHLSDGEIDHEVMEFLEFIALKLIDHYADFKHLLGLETFMDILDMFHGDFRLNVYKCILNSVSRNNMPVLDPVCKNFLFESTKVLHDSLDSFSSDDDRRQIARLVVRFIQLADYGKNLETQLDFLVECRAAFPRMDAVREEVVRASHGIAMSTFKLWKGCHSEASMDFVKSCIAFNEITIPSITDVTVRVQLYITTGEVALMNGLLSYVLNLLKSGILCLQELRSEDSNNEDELRPLLLKLCSFLVVVPGDPELGVLYFPRGLVNLLDAKPWLLKGRKRLQVLLGILSTVSTLSQDDLPYHVANEQVDSNDTLYFGESGYQEELQSFGAMVLEKIVAVVKQEKNALQRGYMLLDTCNTLLMAFENADEMGAQMLERARSLLPKELGYLEATKQRVLRSFGA